MKVGVALLDVITGLQAAIGILAALHERERTGRGRHVSVSLFDASVAAMVNQAANLLIGGIVAGPMGTAHPNICPYQAFQASDRPVHPRRGERPAVRAERARSSDTPSGPTIRRFVTNEERVRHREELIPLLAESFASRTAAEWIDALEGCSPCPAPRSARWTRSSPRPRELHSSSRWTTPDGRRRSVSFAIPSGSTARSSIRGRRRRLLGEHTDEILR